MPKTIAITPSWYWPTGIARVVGVPPYPIYQLCLLRNERDHGDEPAIIDSQGQLTFRQLREEVDRRSQPLGMAAGEARLAVLPGELNRENVLQLLAGLAAGVRLRIAPPGTDAAALASQIGAAAVAGQQSPGSAEAPHFAEMLDPTLSAVIIDAPAAPVSHSNRTLLAMAISMATFIDADHGGPWLSTLPLSSWEGLMAALIPLYLGKPLVIPRPGADPDSLIGLISQHRVGYAVSGLSEFAHACREAKKSAKDARKVLSAALLAVGDSFDPDQRRRVSKALECPALTFWGLPETGPVFAAHQSWYLDESVGLPMTNAHVVPADPRTGQPIQALWELVEMAEVTVFSPSLMTGYEGIETPERFSGKNFRTGVMASSDANGMIYLLG